MTIATGRVAADGPRQREIGCLVGMIAHAKRVARRHPVLLSAALLVAAGGGAAVGVVAAGSSSTSVPAIASDCFKSVAGQGFRVFSCVSGGASVGHPHPRELLVIRDNGSHVAYPAFRDGKLAAGDGEIVALYNVSLVRVTSSRLAPLVTYGELARALHRRSPEIMGINDLRVDTRGDIYFVASVLKRDSRGCGSPLLERTAAGMLRQIRASTTRSATCT